jgi:hypothetical protein
MHEDNGRAKVRIGDEAPLEGTWPQGFTKLGVWLACLAAVAVIGCFFGGAGVAFYAGGGLAIGTILVGLVAAVGGGIGVRSGPDGPRRLDHRAIQRGLWLVLAGFVLGAGVGIALAVAIASNWHS